MIQVVNIPQKPHHNPTPLFSLFFLLCSFFFISLFFASCKNPFVTAILPDRPDKKDAPPTFTVTMENDGNGTANASSDSVTAGEIITVMQGSLVTISAMPGDGYEFDKWQLVSGGAILSSTAASPAVFTMPGKNVTIKALFKALPPNTPNLALDPQLIAFGEIVFGSDRPEPMPVTIKNTGTGAATVSDITLSGDDAGAFELTFDLSEINPIAAGGEAAFTVQPATGLAVGIYESSISVTYTDNKTATALITFAIIPVIIPILELSPSTITFNPAVFGYTQPVAKTITITNTGNGAATVTDIVLSGDNAAAFDLTFDLDEINPIAATNGTATFTVQPKTGLAAGIYESTIMVAYDGDEPAEAMVIFTITAAATPFLELLPSTVAFTPVIFGSIQPVARTVMIANTGTGAATVTDIVLGGANAAAFSLTFFLPNINPIGIDGTANFMVRPRADLAVGHYSATIIVRYDDSRTATNTVTFAVTDIPSYTINMETDGNGVAMAESNSVAAGETIAVMQYRQVTITAMPDDGYRFDAWQVISGGVTLSNTTASLAVFTMPGRNVTIKALFAVLPPDTPHLTLDPQLITFNAVAGHDLLDVAETITIRNTGTGEAVISSIMLSGANAAAFNLAFDLDEINPIAAGGEMRFTVQPVAGLAVGTYTAAITVAYNGDRATTATVTFQVTPIPIPNLNLAPSNIQFGSILYGYTQPAAQTLTIRNTGTGAATVSGIAMNNTTAFDLTYDLASINPIAATNGTALFTVQPKTGLTAGTYESTITVHYDDGRTAEATVTLTVTIPVLELFYFNGFPVKFGAMAGNIDWQRAQTITVRNTGTAAATITDIKLSGTNPDAFELSIIRPDSNLEEVLFDLDMINPIAVNRQGLFRIHPVTWLDAGTYTATITIEYNGIEPAECDVILDVIAAIEPPEYFPNLQLSPSPIEFYAAGPDYVRPEPVTVTMKNTGAGDAHLTSITLSPIGTGPDAFDLVFDDLDEINPIAAEGGTARFTIQPKADLAAGIYDTAVNVNYHFGFARVTVRFVVTENISPLLRLSGGGTFPAAIWHYNQPPDPKTITITNIGTGEAIITNIYANDLFELRYDLDTINPVAPYSGTAAFTIQPKVGLQPVNNTATISVVYNDGRTVTTPVSFRVENEAFRLSPSLVRFEPVEPGYTRPNPKTIAIYASDLLRITNIEISGTDADKFNLAFNLDTINQSSAYDGSANFTVQPKAGLGIGEYTAVITVTNWGATSTYIEKATVIFIVSDIPIPILEMSPDRINFYSFTSAWGQGVFAPRPGARTVTIANTGTSAATVTDIALDGVNADKFVLTFSLDTMNPIPGFGGTASFKIQPIENFSLAYGYTRNNSARIIVTYNNGRTTIANVAYDIMMDNAFKVLPSPAIFAPVGYGYTQPDPITITMIWNNIGDAPRYIYHIWLNGDDPDVFDLMFDLDEITPIAPQGGTATFTVQPKTGLAVGTYSARIDIYMYPPPYLPLQAVEVFLTVKAPLSIADVIFNPITDVLESWSPGTNYDPVSKTITVSRGTGIHIALTEHNYNSVRWTMNPGNIVRETPSFTYTFDDDYDREETYTLTLLVFTANGVPYNRTIRIRVMP